jgi:DNA repair exonuclease SbcCD nuclease subunit
METFGVITDTHYDYKYESRKDDTLQTLINKTEQCYKWFKEQGCSFVVHCGDVFDRHIIYNFYMLGQIRRVLKESGLKTYVILGQHDAQGYNRKTFEKSNLGFLTSISDGSIEFIEERKETQDFVFYACHVDEDVIDRVNTIKKENKPVICLAHALLTDKREAFGTISIKHCKNENVQLVLSGDLHDGVPFQEVNNIQFYNPGALARTEKGTRQPKVGKISWNGNKFDLEEFYPKCPDNKDIFFWDEENIKIASVSEEDSVNFINSFMEFSGNEITNAFDLLLKTGQHQGIDEDVLELIKIYKDRNVK